MTAKMRASEALEVWYRAVIDHADTDGTLALADTLRDAVALAEGLERLATGCPSVWLYRMADAPWVVEAYDPADRPGVVETNVAGPTPLAAVQAALAALDATDE